ncbi:DUF1357 family protein [Borrelia crocidurae]|uniref:Uncharacterized protein n=2 Tax=Borrelia crocidurae TaxID=29520 RepID=W5SJS5_9SPIR|nr:DUF1357 family protein [Borrelia crocidurae]AFI31805.1 Protein of unknown function (DUF1357)-containing protein [Borrelia crocidurae str. Achema]AHH07364.1 Hypothetical protein BCD_1298 [Borrelia crocidurae DOU]
MIKASGVNLKSELEDGDKTVDVNQDLNIDNKLNNKFEHNISNDINNNELLTRAVWITRLADDNLSLSYNTKELINSGHALGEVLDIQVCELIKKYVDEKQILAVAGSLDILNLNSQIKDILLRLASVNIDSFKNSNNSYGLMTFTKGNVQEVLNLRNASHKIKDYKDLKQAMLNEWMQVRQDFYNV